MKNYSLLDSGGGLKLERYGDFVVSRPDPQAIWPKASQNEWQEADASFDPVSRKWKVKNPKIKEADWQVEIENLTFRLSLKNFKHIGVFPEQRQNWAWLKQRVKSGSKILNLFGYTGGATLACAGAATGAEVLHLDASKPSVEAAKWNAKLSGLENAKIRWILDDARKFVERELRRGNQYDGLILDPPTYGRGAKGEVWNIENDLLPLLSLCQKVLKENPDFILMNGYASAISPTSYAQILSASFGLEFQRVEAGELFIKEDSERGFSLPAGIFARWSK